MTGDIHDASPSHHTDTINAIVRLRRARTFEIIGLLRRILLAYRTRYLSPKWIDKANPDFKRLEETVFGDRIANQDLGYIHRFGHLAWCANHTTE